MTFNVEVYYYNQRVTEYWNYSDNLGWRAVDPNIGMTWTQYDCRYNRMDISDEQFEKRLPGGTIKLDKYW